MTAAYSSRKAIGSFFFPEPILSKKQLKAFSIAFSLSPGARQLTTMAPEAIALTADTGAQATGAAAAHRREACMRAAAQTEKHRKATLTAHSSVLHQY